jgi:hypothetical protein
MHMASIVSSSGGELAVDAGLSPLRSALEIQGKMMTCFEFSTRVPVGCCEVRVMLDLMSAVPACRRSEQ